MGLRNLLIALFAGTAIAAGLALALLHLGDPASPRAATVLPATQAVPAFELIDQDGAAVDESLFRGRWDLVFFGFTNCPDICPLTLQTLADARRRLQQEGQDPLPRIVFVSVDPERDSPEVVRSYVRHFGADTIGITGDTGEIEKLTSGLGIYFAKSPAEGDSYSVDHSAVVLVVDPDGMLRAVFSMPRVADAFVTDLPLLMASD